jgi:hypothetical protein
VVHKIAASLESDDQVEVGHSRTVVASNGAKDADIRCAVASRHGDDVITAIDHVFPGDHDLILPAPSIIASPFSADAATSSSERL